MLIKRKNREASRTRVAAITAGLGAEAIDRRAFLLRSGLAVGGLAAAGSTHLGAVKKAQAAGSSVTGPEVQIKKNICTHC
jgi:formate dehydrogenase major subunit